MDDNSQGIAKLTIRIYSVIANSGTNKHNFSDFSNIQTKLRNRLSIKKTHKTNIVQMDIAREHARLGLTTSRGKRKLGHNNEPNDTPETVVTPAPGAPELNDTSFTVIAQHLVEFTNNADLPEPETPVPSIPVPATTNRCARQPARTCIELKDVFNFTNPASGLDFYWKGGELNLLCGGSSG